MACASPGEITALLRSWSGGEAAALDDLIPLVERELRVAARHYLRNKSRDPILDTAALVSEVYLRLIDSSEASWNNRAHFFAVCSKIMRHILVDYARARNRAKRGSGAVHISINTGLAVAAQPSCDLETIHEALTALARIDPRKEQVVELRFFGGLTNEEAAEVLQISVETIKRDWRLAKAWLMRELTGEPP
jgi:RNA polymerase sigma factor (TIGR02999 family)